VVDSLSGLGQSWEGHGSAGGSAAVEAARGRVARAAAAPRVRLCQMTFV
jgi:hypothetical protein